MSPIELVLRIALIVAAASAGFVGDVSVWIMGALGLAAIAATAELAIRPYATSLIDRLLLACGGVVTTLILLGLLLSFMPRGVTRVAWTDALLILSLSVLARRIELGSHLKLPAAPIGVLGVSIAVAAIIIIAAVALALAGVRHWDRQSLLALSLVSSSSNAVVVDIEAVSVTGNYRVVATSYDSGRKRYVGRSFHVSVGGSGEQFQERVPINGPGRWTIDLELARRTNVLRELIVNVGDRAIP